MKISPKDSRLFTAENAKMLKSRSKGYYSIILHLSPHRENSYHIDLCPFSTQECREHCLNSSGFSEMFPNILQVRKKKTDRFLFGKSAFVLSMVQEIMYYERRAERMGLQLCVRLNGTSDIHWAKIRYRGKNIFQWLPHIQFYDYSKSPFIARNSLGISNYDITFSWSGENADMCEAMLEEGFNIAVPFSHITKYKALPEEFMDYPVIDGDINDLRFLDQRGVVVGLRVKGRKQRKIKESNFLVQIERRY